MIHIFFGSIQLIQQGFMAYRIRSVFIIYILAYTFGYTLSNILASKIE
jgi:hypothetical protein